MNTTILNLLTETRPDVDFSESNNFLEEGLLDSFDIISLVTSLDEIYGISIDGEDILPDNFSSINSIIKLVKKKQGNE
jgi:acyl carrier protein